MTQRIPFCYSRNEKKIKTPVITGVFKAKKISVSLLEEGLREVVLLHPPLSSLKGGYINV